MKCIDVSVSVHAMFIREKAKLSRNGGLHNHRFYLMKIDCIATRNVGTFYSVLRFNLASCAFKQGLLQNTCRRPWFKPMVCILMALFLQCRCFGVC